MIIRRSAPAWPEGLPDATPQSDDRVPRPAGGRGQGLEGGLRLRRFGLPDADVLQPQLAAHPLAGAHSFPGLLSSLRGSVTHEAYFDLPSGRHDVYEVSTVLDHLHDVLLRLILKTLGYAGPYQPPIVPIGGPAGVDWVTAGTTPGMLGYF